MNILFLTPQLPYPPRQGTTLRNFYLMRELAKRHHVSLLTFMQAGDQLASDSPLQHICQQIRTVPAPAPRSLFQRAWATLSTPLPDMALRLRSADFQRALSAWLAAEAFDVIQVEGIELAAYLSNAQGQFASLKVFDDHNAEYVLQRSAFQADVHLPLRWHGALYSWIQWHKLERYESLALQQHDAIIAVSPADARALQTLAPTQKIVVIPNGIDTDEFAPQLNVYREAPCDLVFTGKMDYRPNVDAALWFAHDIFPLICAQAPQARFVIVGQQPHARLTSLLNRKDVLLTGLVEDVRPYIARAAVYVAPLRMGGGTRFKALQTMAMGVPLVSTTLGCEGLSVRHERDVLLADSPAEFAAATLRLLGDRALQRQLSAHARELVVTHYDWRKLVPHLEKLYYER